MERELPEVREEALKITLGNGMLKITAYLSSKDGPLF
jgi:hypothetical protein